MDVFHVNLKLFVQKDNSGLNAWHESFGSTGVEAGRALLLYIIIKYRLYILINTFTLYIHSDAFKTFLKLKARHLHFSGLHYHVKTRFTESPLVFCRTT